jgi:quercetin dioxygenase-like cupin family protein
MKTTTKPPAIPVNHSVFFRALGTTYKVLSDSVNGSVAIIEHTVEPKSLGAPMHKHTHEDEISHVLEGELSVMQDGKLQTAGPGEYIVKQRGYFHTFWNAGEKRVRFIEIIAPGGFEHYFVEMAQYLMPGKPPQYEKMKETAAKYGLIVDPYGAEEIIKQYGLRVLP